MQDLPHVSLGVRRRQAHERPHMTILVANLLLSPTSQPRAGPHGASSRCGRMQHAFLFRCASCFDGLLGGWSRACLVWRVIVPTIFASRQFKPMAPNANAPPHQNLRNLGHKAGSKASMAELCAVECSLKREPLSSGSIAMHSRNSHCRLGFTASLLRA